MKDLKEILYTKAKVNSCEHIIKTYPFLENTILEAINEALRIPVVSHRRELLLAFYQHLLDNEPFPINSFSKEREVDRFLKANNCG